MGSRHTTEGQLPRDAAGAVDAEGGKQRSTHGATCGLRLAEMTVGIVVISLGRGGAERQGALWAEAISRQGGRLRVLALEATGSSYSLPPGTELRTLGKTRKQDTPRVLIELSRFAHGCDVVAAFQPYAGLLCRAARVRPYVLVTGQDPRHRRDTSNVPMPLYRAAFTGAAAATAPSMGLIDCHRGLGLAPRSGRWVHLPNIVDERAFRAEPAERSGVLFVGRLVPEKEPLLAMRAAIGAGLSITFLGDGPMRADLLAEARRLGVERLVDLRGFDPEPWTLFARPRVLVLTSRYETFSNVVVESLAAGTPVVAVDCDFGPREILAGATFSHLVGRDEQALCARLAEVALRDSTEAERDECLAIAGRYRGSALEPAIADVLRVGAGR
jgi:glycosyltransferase involved in cell wall biosynthesis